MTPRQALKILIEYNKWRRESFALPPSPPPHTATEIGQAIDVAISALKPKQKGKK